MSVYVDEPKHPLGRMLMCHMTADTLAELHTMADVLGVRKHFQNHRIPHYDICKEKRAEAVALGAIEVTSREIIRKHHGKNA